MCTAYQFVFFYLGQMKILVHKEKILIFVLD
jgi:hypothetical protein